MCSVLACIANGFSYILLNFLPSIYTRSFTYVEFSIIVQPVIYYLVIILQSTFYLLGFTLDNNLYWKSETSLVCLVSIVMLWLDGFNDFSFTGLLLLSTLYLNVVGDSNHIASFEIALLSSFLSCFSLLLFVECFGKGTPYLALKIGFD